MRTGAHYNDGDLQSKPWAWHFTARAVQKPDRDLFDDREMPKALGIFGSAMGLSAMLGPIFGGCLIGPTLPPMPRRSRRPESPMAPPPHQ